MPNAMLDRLVAEREQLVQLCRNVTDTAANSNRDLSDQDREVLTRSRERIDALDAQLTLVSDDLAMDDAVQDRLARLQPGTVEPANVVYRSAGEFMWDVLHRSSREVDMRFQRFMRRAAQHMGTSAAATTPTAGGMPGLLIDPVVGPIIDPEPSGRPFITAIGARTAPDAVSFRRPHIADPTFPAGVDVQALQKAELASVKFDVLSDDLPMTTLGGYLNVSAQLLASTAQALDIVLGQLNRRLAAKQEAFVVAELALTTTTVDPIPAAPEGGDVLGALYAASGAVFNKTGELATWVAVGPAGWVLLGSLTDTAGRPIFPTMGPSNVSGTQSATSFSGSVAGLNVVVTPAITDTTMYVGNADGIEFYEYRYPMMEALEPSVLGRQIAVAAGVNAYRPWTDATGGNGVCKITQGVTQTARSSSSTTK